MYSAKIQFEAPNDAAAYDMLCRFLYAYEQMRDDNEDVGIVERGAVVVHGESITPTDLAEDQAIGDAEAAADTAGLNPNPLPEGMPQV